MKIIMISKPFVFSISPKFISSVVSKALYVELGLLGGTTFVIVYVNEHTLLLSGEGNHLAFTPHAKLSYHMQLHSNC